MAIPQNELHATAEAIDRVAQAKASIGKGNPILPLGAGFTQQEGGVVVNHKGAEIYRPPSMRK